MSQEAVFSKAEAGKRNTLKIYVPSWVVVRGWFVIVLREAVKIACVCWRCNLWKGQSDKMGTIIRAGFWTSTDLLTSQWWSCQSIPWFFLFTLVPRIQLSKDKQGVAAEKFCIQQLFAESQEDFPQNPHWFPTVSNDPGPLGLCLRGNFSTHCNKVGRKDLKKPQCSRSTFLPQSPRFPIYDFRILNLRLSAGPPLPSSFLTSIPPPTEPTRQTNIPRMFLNFQLSILTQMTLF